MERLDTHEKFSSPMEKYLSMNGWHFSEALCKWACEKMKDRAGNKHQFMDKQKVDEMMKNAGVQLKNDVLYDACYIANMKHSDSYGGSIKDMNTLALSTKEYLDDIDGSETRALDEFVGKMIGMGKPIPWSEVL